MRIIVGAGLAGWFGIVALAYWLADARIALCWSDDRCSVAATATRDNLLIGGAVVALIVLICVAVFEKRQKRRGSENPTVILKANREPRRRLLP